MKHRTLPVKRSPASKGIFKRLRAVTRNRRQRVAAVANGELDGEESGSKISRALTIIFLIHIIAIGLIFFHQKFLDDRSVEAPPAAAPVAAPREDLPILSQGDSPYIVKRGDNYSRIAAENQVDEAELRRLNNEVEISAGLILKIPPKRIVAVDPPEVAAIRTRTADAPDGGLVEAVPAGTPKAQLVKPKLPAPAPKVMAVSAAVVPSGKTYVVQPGDSIWRIANRYKVDQASLMKANGIADDRKMKTGMKLVIPR